MVKPFAPDFPPVVQMPMCEVSEVWPDSRQDASEGGGGEGNATNDSDADIGDKSCHRFCAVLREHLECKYCFATIHGRRLLLKNLNIYYPIIEWSQSNSHGS